METGVQGADRGVLPRGGDERGGAARARAQAALGAAARVAEKKRSRRCVRALPLRLRHGRRADGARAWLQKGQIPPRDPPAHPEPGHDAR
eukprot:3355544-Rhodomonas_salina.3